MIKKSPTIETKLDKVLNNKGCIIHKQDPAFSTIDQFTNYIAEGALLNITKVASNALSIPSGEYMVWVTDVGHTMLVPVNHASNKAAEVYENKQDEYEIETPKLLQHWNTIQIVLAEEEAKPPEANQFVPDTSNIKRKAMYRAMQNNGYADDYGALADQVGVQTPMISRILSGDRTPSMGTASQLCNALNSDPTALFPDVFDVQIGKKHKPKKVPGNRGSGMANTAAGSRKKGKASKKWTQGADQPAESVLSVDQIITEIDSTINKSMDDQTNVKQLQDQMDKNSEEQQRAKRERVEPQIKQINTDIDKLSDELEQGEQLSMSSSREFENMQSQIDQIQSQIEQITSRL